MSEPTATQMVSAVVAKTTVAQLQHLATSHDRSLPQRYDAPCAPTSPPPASDRMTLKACAVCGAAAEPGKTRCAQHPREKLTTSQRGLGWDHQLLRQNALAKRPYCARCGHKGSADNPLTADHIIPRSRGGLNTASNYETLCRRCNSSKGAA
jgi:5-methylcytosine-specific restriction endonuclease McrA